MPDPDQRPNFSQIKTYMSKALEIPGQHLDEEFSEEFQAQKVQPICESKFTDRYSVPKQIRRQASEYSTVIEKKHLLKSNSIDMTNGEYSPVMPFRYSNKSTATTSECSQPICTINYSESENREKESLGYENVFIGGTHAKRQEPQDEVFEPVQ